MVRNGQELAPAPETGDVRTRFHDPRAALLLAPLIDAVNTRPAKTSAKAPYARSTVIRTSARTTRELGTTSFTSCRRGTHRPLSVRV